MPVIAPSSTACTAPRPKSSALVAPGDAEQAEADGVEDQDAAPDVLEQRPAEEGDQPGRAGGGQIARVAEGRRRHADQQVAGDPPGERHDRGEHDDAEEVELGPHGRRALR